MLVTSIFFFSHYVFLLYTLQIVCFLVTFLVAQQRLTGSIFSAVGSTENVRTGGRWFDVWLAEWCFTPLSTVFQSYHGDYSHYSCLSWVSPVLGSGPEVSYPRTLPRKTQRIQCSSKPGPLDSESNRTTEPRRTPMSLVRTYGSANILSED